MTDASYNYPVSEQIHAARAVLANPAAHPHAKAAAANYLDWMDAERSVNRAVAPPPYSQGPGSIRRLLVGVVMMLVAVWAILAGVMAL